MTTIIGIKCKDGIVLASDSQATSQITKNMQVSKIFQINDSIGVGTAGSEPSIKVLIESLRQRITLDDLKTEQKLIEKLEIILLDLHRHYNVERSLKLGFPISNIQWTFNVTALVGVKLSNNQYSLLHILQDGWIDRVDSYQAVGSGFPLANLVYTQQNRIPMIEGKSISDFELDFNIWIASYIINEVKAVEPYTGGNTRIVVITSSGFQEIPENVQREFYENTRAAISNVMQEKLSIEEKKTDFRTIFPEN